MTLIDNVVDEWDWWRRKLAGEPMEMNPDNPHAGFYRMPHKETYGAKKTWTPVCYYPAPNADGSLNCRIDGREVSVERGQAIWHHCGNHPIEEEVYREVAERDGKWPDEHELIPMARDNQPPEDDSYEGLRDAIDDLAREAKERIEGAPIQDQAEADRLGNLADRLAELWKKADAARKAEKAPFDEAARKVQVKWAPILLAAETYKNIKYKLITPWLLKLKAAKQEAAQQAAAVGTVPVQEKSPRAGTRGRAMTLKTVKRADIVVYSECLAFFAENPDVKQLVQDLANRMVRAGVTVPGTKVIEEEQAV